MYIYTYTNINFIGYKLKDAYCMYIIHYISVSVCLLQHIVKREEMVGYLKKELKKLHE